MSMISLLESLALSIVSTFILLGIARVSFQWIRQPADRVLVIQLAITASCLIPLLVLAPWSWYRLPINVVPAEPTIVTSTVPREIPPQQTTLLQTSSNNGPSTIPAPIPAIPSPQTATTPPVSSVETATFVSWEMVSVAIIAMCFLVPLVYTVLQIYFGRRALNHLKQHSAPATPSVVTTWNQLTDHQYQHVRLLVANNLDSPIVFGLFHPTILLPSHLVHSENDRLVACLAHEWSHILRHDLLTSRLVWFTQILLWFQPAYWSLRNELRLCQDQLADDFAASNGRNPIRYSELLLEFARRQHQRPLAGSLALAHNTSHLTRRMTMLLEPKFTTRQKTRRRFFALSMTLTAFFAIALTGIRLDAAPQNEAKPATTTENIPTDAITYTCEIVDKSNGQPIPDATIVVRRSKLMNTSNDTIEETKHTTDANGKYSFTIPPDQLKEKYLYIELDVDHKNFAAKKGFGYAMSMILKNEKLGERPFFERTELMPADTLVGTVLKPDGQPANDVKILAFSMPDGRDFNDMSFTETKTQANGEFHLNVIKNSSSVYWVLPKDFANIERFIDKDHKAQGTITLEAGIRAGGVVVDAAGKPLANVAVNINTKDRNTGNLPVATSLSRGAITDNEGRFEFLPLPLGNYRLDVSEFRSEPTQEDSTRYNIPDVFSAQDVTIANDTTTTSFKIQAVPTVTFSAQYLDSQGKPTTGHSFYLFGELNEIWYNTTANPDREGKVSQKIPKGLKDLRVSLSTNEHGSLRYRTAQDQPLKNNKDDIRLGPADHDITGFEIVRYKAPITLISPVDAEGKTIKTAYVTAKYPWGDQRFILKDDRNSDLTFEHQQDGRFRTSQMLPDEDVTFTIGAEGYETQTIAPINLKEGEVKEVTVTLRPAKK